MGTAHSKAAFEKSIKFKGLLKNTLPFSEKSLLWTQGSLSHPLGNQMHSWSPLFLHPKPLPHLIPGPPPCSSTLNPCLTPPYVPPKVTELLEEGGASHPDVIEFAFTSLSTVFKHLTRHLSADLPAALRATARLRYSAAAGKHVRAFAAQVKGEIGKDGSRSDKGVTGKDPSFRGESRYGYNASEQASLWRG